jgi:hypothetical protein
VLGIQTGAAPRGGSSGQACDALRVLWCWGSIDSSNGSGPLLGKWLITMQNRLNNTQLTLTAALLLSTTALYGGCGISASGLNGVELPSDAPTIVNNADPMARPTQVAWTAARAQRCGFSFDPAKLKANYIAYESKQGAAGDQLARIQKTYESTLQATSAKISTDPGYCANTTTSEIKLDLTRHLAGDYTPNLPKPKAGQSCGILGCPLPIVDEPYDPNSFWQKKDHDISSNGRGG